MQHLHTHMHHNEATTRIHYTIIESQPSPTWKKDCNLKSIDPSLSGFVSLVLGPQAFNAIQESIHIHQLPRFLTIL